MKLLQTSTTASLLALASISTTAYAAGKKVPPKAKAHTVEGFAWPNPFESVALKDYSATCEASASLPATEFQLHDLYEEAPLGLLPWADALKEFFSGHEYPGGWEGQDPHGYDRLVLKMEWKDVPAKARQWIEKNGGALFGIYKKPDGEGKKVSKRATPSADGKLEDHVVIFAPGALYGILPLFVANGSACEDALLNLDSYASEPKDGGVISGVVKHSEPDRQANERDIEFSINAQTLKLQDPSKEEL